MPWFLTPHGPHFVVEPGTIDEYERRDYTAMTQQQVTDYFAGVAFPDPPSFATEAEVPGIMATVAADPGSAFSVQQRAASVAAVEDAETVSPTGIWDLTAATTQVVAASETDTIEAFNIVPATPGAAPWSVRYDSVANAGGRGYNNGVWLGFNAEYHSGGTPTPGKAGMIMGFESNYWDAAGPDFGPEWYVEYWSPDGTTTQMLRPFYVRVEGGSDTQADNCIIHMDIGGDGNGFFAVFADKAAPNSNIFTVTPVQVQSTKNFIVSGTQFSLKPPAGNPLLLMDGVVGTAPMLRFSIGGAPKFSFYAADATTFVFNSSLSPVHMRFYAGATADAATTELTSTLRLNNTPATTATAGSAAALPATPQGYFQIKDATGAVRKVPYYV